MNLFEQAAGQEAAPQPLGFRLQRLEVYNWGTFDGQVWALDLHGDTALLTGDVGSGKSTLVDAVITLLVPPRKVTYNKAADASAKERSLTSYVRGYYGQSRTQDGGGRPEALRTRESYTVILGVFGDRNFGRTVTLAQVFWFPDATASTPSRFYVKADGTLSIVKDFSNLGTDMRAFRKQLEQRRTVHTFDDYPAYGHEFRKAFGLRQVQAMDLFQQTVSMKKVDSLTDFVRQNMLEQPAIDQEIELLLSQYHDLEQAHEAVERAKKQLAVLEPLEQAYGTYQDLARQLRECEAMTQALSAWLGEADYARLQRRLHSQQEEAKRLQEESKDSEQRIARQQQELDELRLTLRQNGGDQLESMQQKLKRLQQQEQDAQAQRQRYAEWAEELDLPMPEDEAGFAANGERLTALTQELAEQRDTLVDEAADYSNNVQEQQKRQQELQQEIASLSQRKSNIPRQFVELRGRLCQALDVAEQELPFAGELMAVKEEESAWEGALERLLHGFGLSLLVPEVHYTEVLRWLEGQKLGLKLVYFRVPAEAEDMADDETMPDGTACSKLQLRPEAPLRGWLAQELRQRYNHVCCEDVKDFRQQRFALSPQGQIKTNGRRHEKDDRYDIHDRHHYVLGFSNQRKLQTLQDDLAVAKSEKEFFQKQLRANKQAQAKCQQQATNVQLLAQVTQYAAIDTAAQGKAVAECRALVDQLRQQNDAYRQLEQAAAKAQTELTRLRNAALTLQSKLSGAQNSCKLLKEQMASDERLAAKLTQAEKDYAYPLLQKYAVKALAAVAEDTPLPERQSVYSEWINHLRLSLTKKQEKAASSLQTQIGIFRSKWPENCLDFSTSAEGASDYVDFLAKLRRDDLPRFEGRFREMLRENTINQLVLFHTHLQNCCRSIEERIARINESLAEIDYNPGRYIQISCIANHNEIINEFRQNLRLCTSDVLTGDDETYSERKFEEVTQILARLQGRPEHTETDARWRQQVTDVRNWYKFAAEECWRETGEEYEHYTDSGGKSGGQKEKLAYTILAASIVYNFGLEGQHAGEQSFRFVVIDEAFLKSSDESARFGLELFQKLDLQLLVVTPLLKIATIEPYVQHVGFVYLKDAEHRSYLRNLTIKEFQDEKAAFDASTEHE